MSYSRVTDRKSFSQLLLTMADMEKEHERRLAELKGKRAWASALAGPGSERFTLEEPFKQVTFSPDMEYGDFLVLVIHKETEAERLYLQLEGLAASADARDCSVTWPARRRSTGTGPRRLTTATCAGTTRPLPAGGYPRPLTLFSLSS